MYETMNDLSLTILPETPNDAYAIERCTSGPSGPAATCSAPTGCASMSITCSISVHGPHRDAAGRVGAATADEKPATSRPCCWVHRTVEPPFRNRGVGRALLDRASRTRGRAAIVWCSWLATKPTTAASAFAAYGLAGEPSCRDRLTTIACWSPNSPKVRSRESRRNPPGLERSAIKSRTESARFQEGCLNRGDRKRVNSAPVVRMDNSTACGSREQWRYREQHRIGRCRQRTHRAARTGIRRCGET